MSGLNNVPPQPPTLLYSKLRAVYVQFSQSVYAGGLVVVSHLSDQDRITLDSIHQPVLVVDSP